jgi:hypothetical protein
MASHSKNPAKPLVGDMQNYASKLKKSGETERANLISSWAKVLDKIGSMNIKFIAIACLSSLFLSCLYSSAVISGNAISGSYLSVANLLGICFFLLGLLLATLYLKARNRKA